MRWTSDFFCAFDHRLSPSTNARPAERMAILSFAKATSSTTIAIKGQMMTSSRLLRESDIQLGDSDILFPYEVAPREVGAYRYVSKNYADRTESVSFCETLT